MNKFSSSSIYSFFAVGTSFVIVCLVVLGKQRKNMEKTFSQRAARFLEIICYFLIIPTSLIEIVTIYYSSVSIISGELGLLFFAIPITATYAFGNLLLYGYYKHSRGKLSNESSFLLWVGTLVFNSIPFAYMLFVWNQNHSILRNSTEEGYWFYNIFAFYSAIILLAVIALIDDIRRLQVSPRL
ncbi:MAG: hypothetical protein ABI954_07300 [Pyrinomonadaceae bacterium]